MAAVKDCYACTSYFVKKYKEKYGYDPKPNKFAARWGWDAVLMDMSVDDAQALIDYYFLTTSANRHNIDWFFRNYDKLLNARNTHAEDSVQRARLRAESAERAAQWRERIGNQRTTSN